MTHLEKFVALYKEFGIDVKVEKTNTGFSVKLSDSSYKSEEDIFTTFSDKLDGYSSFYSDIEFDGEGNFKRQGFWE